MRSIVGATPAISFLLHSGCSIAISTTYYSAACIVGFVTTPCPLPVDTTGLEHHGSCSIAVWSSFCCLASQLPSSNHGACPSTAEIKPVQLHFSQRVHHHNHLAVLSSSIPAITSFPSTHFNPCTDTDNGNVFVQVVSPPADLVAYW